MPIEKLEDYTTYRNERLDPKNNSQNYKIIAFARAEKAKMKAIYTVPATLALVYRAHTHKSLTPGGIIASVLTAIAHAVHPWNLPFVLLIVFFLAGTKVTKVLPHLLYFLSRHFTNNHQVKRDIKATLTVHSTGGSGGEGPRNWVQVLANSSVASILSILHAYTLYKQPEFCYGFGGLARNILPIGILANYASVAADTFSSELGILSASLPRLITSPTFRKVPKGTNGGVTGTGLLAGLAGSAIVSAVGTVLLPVCPAYVDATHNVRAPTGTEGGYRWSANERLGLFVALTLWGALGSVLDSILGGLFQATVKDVRTGRVIEGDGGRTVLVHSASRGGSVVKDPVSEVKTKVVPGREGLTVVPTKVDEDTETGEKTYDATKRASDAGLKVEGHVVHKESRVVEAGWGVLDNNEVNFLMALNMSAGAMLVAAWYWGVEVPKSLVGYGI